MDDIFDVLILVGRPASGKSEIIDFLSRLPAHRRREEYHFGEFHILDDFPMLWAWLEEDEILSSKLGRPRLHTDERGYFLHPSLWHLLIERLGLEYKKCLAEDPNWHRRVTALIEFSRGSEHGGYAAALPHLGEDLLRRAAILYVNVSFAESLRKNRRRLNPNRPHSILQHSLSDTKMERLYRHDDWAEIAPEASGWLDAGGIRVPYTVFENEDDVTTGKPELLPTRLKMALDRLWDLRHSS